MTSDRGHETVLNGWKKSVILSAVEKGSDNLPNLDPFHDIDPLTVGSSAFQETARLNLDPAELESYRRVKIPDDDDDEMNGKYP